MAKGDNGHLAFSLESFISYSITETDLYTIAVSGFDDFNFDGIGGFGDIDINFLYTASVTSVSVPATTWLYRYKVTFDLAPL